MAAASIFTFAAMDKGASALVNMAAMAGLAVPCVAGIFLFGESFTPWRAAGLVFIVISARLLIGHSSSLKGKPGIKMILMVFAVFLFNGTFMLSQKMFTHYAPLGESSAFTFWMFAFTSAFLWLACLFIKSEKTTGIQKGLRSDLVVLALAVLIITFCTTEASRSISAVVLFPLYSGLGLVLATISSSVGFKEPFTLKCVLGMIAGICGAALINFG